MYTTFAHEADIGIVGKGKTLEEAFEEGAKALFDVQVEIEKVEPKKAIKIEVEADNKEELFVEWLNRLITEAEINTMVFSEFNVKIKDNKLIGTAKGELFNEKKHTAKDHVKAATYSELGIKKEKDLFVVKCVVDV